MAPKLENELSCIFFVEYIFIVSNVNRVKC